MAAFFSPRVYSPYAPQHHQQAAPEPSFHGLFRLLEDWDNHHNNTSTANSNSNNNNTAVGNKQQQRQQQRQARRQRLHQQPEQPAFFTPRFDVKETNTAYELFGDLPGVDKKDISIEFSDPQTLIVKGHVERSSSSVETRDGSGKLITAEAHGEEDDAVMVDHAGTSTAAAADDDHHAETSSQRSFRATVEDDNEDATTTSATTAKTSDKPTSTDTTVAAAPAPSTAELEQEQEPQQPTHKYWISERSFGSFSRTFAFPERLDLDGVSASLENGVLALTVPKARKYEARRISLL